MSDNIDIESVDQNTFTVRPLGGAALPGKYSSQMGLVNFAPEVPLLDDTIYEVVVDGMQDWVGNAGGSFVSLFSTGDDAPACTLDALPPVEVGVLVDLDVLATTGADLTYSWDFGDGSAPTPPAAPTRCAPCGSSRGTPPARHSTTGSRRSG